MRVLYARRAHAHLCEKRLTDAEADLDEILNVESGDPIAHFLRAEIASTTGDHARAIEHYTASLTSQAPLVATADDDEDFAEFSPQPDKNLLTGFDVRKRDDRAAYQRGKSYVALGDLERAIEQFTKIRAMFDLGECKLKLGRTSEAKADLEAARKNGSQQAASLLIQIDREAALRRRRP